jgi:hypothetical protein
VFPRPGALGCARVEIEFGPVYRETARSGKGGRERREAPNMSVPARFEEGAGVFKKISMTGITGILAVTPTHPI